MADEVDKTLTPPTEPVAGAKEADAVVAEVKAADSMPAAETSAEAAPASDIAPTLLEKFDAEQKAAEPAAAALDAKPEAEAPKPADAKPEEGKEAPAEAAPEPLPPIDYKYNVPEGFVLSDDRKGELTTALDAFRANPAEGAQALMDLHTKALAEFAEQTRQNQVDVFNNTTADWEKLVMADPILGGAGHNTAMQAVARARDWALNSVPPSQREDFRQDFEHFLRVTGAGSHPAFLKFAHAFDALLEPQSDNIPTDILPPKDIGKPPPGARRSGNGLYDHPRGNTDG